MLQSCRDVFGAEIPHYVKNAGGHPSVAPRVHYAAGLDGDRYTGWAFGMGPARVAMLRYNIPDIRILYDSDVRFLYQIAQ